MPAGASAVVVANRERERVFVLDDVLASAGSVIVDEVTWLLAVPNQTEGGREREGEINSDESG